MIKLRRAFVMILPLLALAIFFTPYLAQGLQIDPKLWNLLQSLLRFIASFLAGVFDWLAKTFRGWAS